MQFSSNAYMYIRVVFSPLLSLCAQGTKRVVAVDTMSQFYSWIEPSQLKLPAGTMVFEETERQVVVVHVFVCLTLLDSFFLPSHLSFKNMYIFCIVALLCVISVYIDKLDLI